MKARNSHPSTQQGVTLMELLVGVAVGLLVVAVAMGSLLVSRSVSGTVNDTNGLQQQAAYAMRTIGMQLRQAGSLYLNLNPNNVAGDGLASQVPVAFETSAPATGKGNSFDPITNTISGSVSPVSLTVGYRRYKESLYPDGAEQSLARNCLGGPADTSVDQRIESVFQLSGSDLRCSGNSTAAQPVIQNVADFQVRYLVQDNASSGDAKIQYVAASSVNDWSKVQAVEVCLVLHGTELIDMPKGSSYTGCGGTSVDMTVLSGARAKRMHITFSNVFQLRSQGLIGTVL